VTAAPPATGPGGAREHLASEAVSPKLGISLLAYAPDRLAGAGTYTLGLTKALTDRAPRHYTVFVPRQYSDLWTAGLSPLVRVVVCGPDPRHRILRVFFEQFVLGRLARRYHIDAVIFPHLFAPRWQTPRAIVTIYDLLLLSGITDFQWYKRLYHRWAYREAAHRADVLLTISEFCRSDIVAKLGVAPGRICVAPPGLDAEFTTDRLDSGRSPAPSPYVLCIAGSYPHKRLPTVVQAFARVQDELPDLRLVIAGTYAGERGSVPELKEVAEREGIASKLRVLPRLPRPQMRALIENAEALVSASTFEGFGIPILEAMAVGCPVAASPAEGVKEVLGGCGWLAADLGAEALAVALGIALGARRSATDVLRRAKERARATYTWGAAAGAVEGVVGIGLPVARGGGLGARVG
jgi:glycosyltransferase involved in cell wall biosynthesis